MIFVIYGDIVLNFQWFVWYFMVLHSFSIFVIELVYIPVYFQWFIWPFLLLLCWLSLDFQIMCLHLDVSAHVSQNPHTFQEQLIIWLYSDIHINDSIDPDTIIIGVAPNSYVAICYIWHRRFCFHNVHQILCSMYPFPIRFHNLFCTLAAGQGLWLVITPHPQTKLNWFAKRTFDVFAFWNGNEHVKNGRFREKNEALFFGVQKVEHSLSKPLQSPAAGLAKPRTM